MSEALQHAIQGVNDNGQEVLRRLWENDLMPLDVLRSEVEAYMAYVTEDVVARRPFVDADLANAIGKACVILLDGLGEGATDEQHRLVQLAGLYFIATEDDLDGAMGFDDDARVVNNVATFLGRDDVIIDI